MANKTVSARKVYSRLLEALEARERYANEALAKANAFAALSREEQAALKPEWDRFYRQYKRDVRIINYEIDQLNSIGASPSCVPACA